MKKKRSFAGGGGGVGEFFILESLLNMTIWACEDVPRLYTTDTNQKSNWLKTHTKKTHAGFFCRWKFPHLTFKRTTATCLRFFGERHPQSSPITKAQRAQSSSYTPNAWRKNHPALGRLPSLAPENGWLEDDRFPFGKAYVQGRTVSFRKPIQTKSNQESPGYRGLANP